MNDKLLATLLRTYANRLERELDVLTDSINQQGLQRLRTSYENGDLMVLSGIDMLLDQLIADADRFDGGLE